MVMTTHAPTLHSVHTSSRLKRDKKAEPRGSMIGREADGKMIGDSAASPWATAPCTEAGTVIAAGKFKATCLRMLDRAAKGETITITKRGKIVGRLVPPAPEPEQPFVPLLGRMEGMVRIHGDIVGPRLDWWENR